jgi:Ca-activated chloride channel family protein
MKRAVAGIALLCASGFAHSTGWADLWSRPDQQTIAEREQAYTEMQGQQYAAAAERLKPFADPISQYNRGNALAHTGDLQAALSAYDAVLRDGAADAGLKRDAQHNRDLVEQQSKSQQQSDQSGRKGDKDQKNDKGSKDDKSGNDGKAQSGDNAQQNKGQDNKKGDKEQGKKGEDDKSQDKGDQASKGADSQDTGEPPPGDKSPRDMARAAPDPKSPAAQEDATPANVRPGDASQAPQSEQARSLDQWLRWIPDDPGGLLRRKFMIEHMQNQHGTQQ